MEVFESPFEPNPMEFLMRFAPAAAALSLLFAVSASVGNSAEPAPDPRAAVLLAQGRASLSAGQPEAAIDAFEAALVVDPAYSQTLIDLGDAVRREGLQGKAIHYYREALARDPNNLAALSGEGQAMAEKGAIAKARLNLSKLQSLCGANCADAQQLAAVISKGPREAVLTAEAVMPKPVVTQN